MADDSPATSPNSRHESQQGFRIAVVIPLILVLSGVLLVIGLSRTFYLLRERAMRAFAARWGFQYIGPLAPKWRHPSHIKIDPPLPVWISSFHVSGRPIRQIYNVIEGQENGKSILIFDSIIGEKRGSAPCTFIVYQSEQNPFGMVTSRERVIQSHGCTVLHGVWFLWVSWPMSIKKITAYVDELRTGSSVT